MTEEQKGLAELEQLLEQCIRCISDIRGAFTHDEQLALAKGFRDLAIREREPATEAVLEALKRIRAWDMVHEPAPGVAEPCHDAPQIRELIDRALK